MKVKCDMFACGTRGPDGYCQRTDDIVLQSKTVIPYADGPLKEVAGDRIIKAPICMSFTMAERWVDLLEPEPVEKEEPKGCQPYQYRTVKVERNGVLETIPFRDIKKGDKFTLFEVDGNEVSGGPVVAMTDAAPTKENPEVWGVEGVLYQKPDFWRAGG